MNGAEHAQRAEHVLKHLATAIRGGDSEWAPIMAAQAQAHALLAQVQYLREIGDQLDSVPRPAKKVPSPLHDAAALLESVAIGDEGAQRERTVAKLVLHSIQGRAYVDASDIARAAHRDSVGTDLAAPIEAAVMLLGIDH